MLPGTGSSTLPLTALRYRSRMQRLDAIVVGAGAMGTAAARNLAMTGRETLLIERFSIGHPNGSSGGPTRIFRYAYHDVGYVRLAMAARETWDELEDASGEPLFRVTGCIDVGPEALQRASLLEAVGLRVERMSGADANERWPSLALPIEADVVFQPDGAVLKADRTVEAQARLAVAAGATIVEGTTVVGISAAGDGVALTTSDGTRFETPVAVVAAGPWAEPLLATAGIDVPLRPTLEQVTYFELGPDRAAPPPVIDWLYDEEHPAYVVPDPWEPGGFKVGLHRSGPATDADGRSFDPDPGRLQRVLDYVAVQVPAARPTDRTDTCLYTITPDEDFVLDRVGPVVIASPCSGHGFKFAPLFGRALAALAAGDEPVFDLSAFRIDRPSLARR